MQANKAYKYRVYPDTEQMNFLNICFDVNRKTYNYFLEHLFAYHETEKDQEEKTPMYDRIKTISRTHTVWKSKNEWMKAAPARSKELLIKNNLYPAFAKWFKAMKNGDIARKRAEYIERCKKTGKKIKQSRLDGFFKPKFKSFKDRQSFQLDKGLRVDLEKGLFLLTQRIGWIKFKIKPGDKILSPGIVIKCATVSKDLAGAIYVSFSVHDPAIEEMPLKRAIKKKVGINLGVRNLITFSDGQKEPNPKFYESQLKAIITLQKKMSRQYRQNSGKTKNWEKTRVKLAKKYRRLADWRKNLTHQLTNQITNDFDFICFQRWDVKGMVKETMPEPSENGNGFEKTGKSRDKKLHRNVLDANFFEYRRQLEYKALWKGKTIYELEESFPATKKCYICKEINADLDTKRMPPIWTCPSCGTENDIDQNHALNCLEEGIKNIKK